MLDRTPRSERTRAWIFLIGLLIVAFALRLYRLEGQSIWVDEGISLHLATSSPRDIVADRAGNLHPPLYFFLLKGWVTLAGTRLYTARFLSVLASTLQVAAIYAVARRRLGRRTACVAAVLMTISPLSIIYGQEVRTYALLPLVYLALLGLAHALTARPGPHPRSTWLFLGIAEVVGLHLHYSAMFLVVYVALWTLAGVWRAGRRAGLYRWFVTHAAAVLASLPWAIAVLTQRASVQTRFAFGRGLTEPMPLAALPRQVWLFFLTGLTPTGDRGLVSGLALAILLLLLLLVLVRLPRRRRLLVDLLLHWLVPLSLALLLWSVRSFSHPRYVTLFAPGLILLAAYVLRPSHRPATPLSRAAALPALLLGAGLVAISLLGLRAYFFDPAFAKDDVRGVARYLEQAAGPADLIVIPHGDWSLPFAYEGPAPIYMPDGSGEASTWRELARRTAQPGQVFVLDYRRDWRDWRGTIFFALERAGTKVAIQDFNGLLIHAYRLEQPVETPALLPVDVRFGPFTLVEAWVEQEAPSGTAVTLALRWRLDAPVETRHGLALRLLDVDHWPLAGSDGLLLDERSYPTPHWAVGRETTTYHVLPVPSTTPPLTYTLSVALYEQTQAGPRPLDVLDAQSAPQGQRLELADVRVSPPDLTAPFPYEDTTHPPALGEPVELAPGLQLVGAGPDRESLSPGQPLFVTLHWRATRAPLPDLRPRLALVQEGRELDADTGAPAQGRYPTGRWQAGQEVLEHRELVPPPTAEEGVADVVLTLGEARHVVGQVTLRAGEHTFTPPPIAHPLDVRFGEVARLAGYELQEERIAAGQPVTLTLYWEALEGASGGDYAVFTHVLAADGHLVGQHDGVPVEGRRPTAGWLAREFLVDRHVMTFREMYTGTAHVEVGLYDPETLERVPVTGENRDFFLLPVELEIVP
jgi:hypothetical protein